MCVVCILCVCVCVICLVCSYLLVVRNVCSAEYFLCSVQSVQFAVLHTTHNTNFTRPNYTLHMRQLGHTYFNSICFLTPLRNARKPDISYRKSGLLLTDINVQTSKIILVKIHIFCFWWQKWALVWQKCPFVPNKPHLWFYLNYGDRSGDFETEVDFVWQMCPSFGTAWQNCPFWHFLVLEVSFSL